MLAGYPVKAKSDKYEMFSLAEFEQGPPYSPQDDGIMVLKKSMFGDGRFMEWLFTWYGGIWL